MRRDLEIDLLRSMVAVAAHKNFTKAAQSIGRTQSAVSLQIKRLEDIVGKRLFERSRHAVDISPTGEALLVYANRIIAANDAALSHILRPAAEGLVRIGAPDDYATFLLPPILSALSKEYPLIRFEVLCENSCDLLPMIENDQLDLVIAVHPQDAVGGRIARYEPLHWVASPEYVDDPDEPLSMVLFPTGCVCRDIALSSLEHMERAWQVTYSTRSIALIEQALLTGSGVSVMEASVIPPSLKILDGATGFPRLPDVVISVHQKSNETAAHIQLAVDFVLAALSKRTS